MYFLVYTYTGGNEVQKLETLQGFGSRQGYVRLSVLKHFGQGDFNSPVSYPVNREGRGGGEGGSAFHTLSIMKLACVFLTMN